MSKGAKRILVLIACVISTIIIEILWSGLPLKKETLEIDLSYVYLVLLLNSIFRDFKEEAKEKKQERKA